MLLKTKYGVEHKLFIYVPHGGNAVETFVGGILTAQGSV
jgi:hypothetical protein